MKLKKKIKDHFEKVKFSRISRLDLKGRIKISRGYIVGFSKKLVLLHETDDFRVLGFNVIEKSKIKSIRYDENDQYYDKIMKWENQLSKVGLKEDVCIQNWKKLFKELKVKGKNVIIEREGKKYGSFVIGVIERVTGKKVFIRYFDAKGTLEKKLTKIKYKSITKVTFDDRYINVFGKYLNKK